MGRQMSWKYRCHLKRNPKDLDGGGGFKTGSWPWGSLYLLTSIFSSNHTQHMVRVCHPFFSLYDQPVDISLVVKKSSHMD